MEQRPSNFQITGFNTAGDSIIKFKKAQINSITIISSGSEQSLYHGS